MTSDDLRAWQTHMGYTPEQAADALNIGRATWFRLLSSDQIDRRTELACAALAAGITRLELTPAGAH